MIGTGESCKPVCTLLVVAGHADTPAVISKHARANGHSVISASTPHSGYRLLAWRSRIRRRHSRKTFHAFFLSRPALPASRDMLHAEKQRMLRFGI